MITNYPGRSLNVKLLQVAEMTRFQVRYQEAGGIQLARLFSTDLGKGQPCGSEECHTSGRYGKAEKIPNCRQANIVYESSCQICNQEDGSIKKDEKDGRNGIHLGETSRTLHERTREPFKDASDFSEGSHMVKDWLTSNEDEETCPDFKFRIVGNVKD